MNQNLVDYIVCLGDNQTSVDPTLVDEVYHTSVNFDQAEVNQIQETELVPGEYIFFFHFL